MAWQSQGWKLVVRQVDSGANENSKTYNLTAATAADAATESLIIINGLEAVSALTSRTYSIIEKFANDAFALAAAGVQGEAKAVIICTDSVDPGKTHVIEISGPETDVFIATTGSNANIVDIAHQDVIDYCNLFDSAGEATISDGESIETDGLVRGYRRTAKKKYG